MNDKKLLVTIGVDERSARATENVLLRVQGTAKKTIEEVARAMQAASGAMGAPTLTGGRGAKPGTVMQRTGIGTGKQIVGNLGADPIVAVKKVADANLQALRSMTTEIKNSDRAYVTMATAVAKVAREFDALNGKAQTFAELAASIPNGADLAPGNRSSFFKTMGYSGRTGAFHDATDMFSRPASGGGNGDYHSLPPGAGGGGERGHPIAKPPGQPGLSGADAALIGAAVARAVGTGVSNVGGAIQASKLYGDNNSASIQQQTTGRFLNRMLQGDVRDFHAMRFGQTYDGKNVGQAMLDSGAWGGTGAASAQIIGQAIEGVATTAASVATMVATKGAGAAGGAAGGITRTAGDVTSAAGGLLAGPTALWNSWQAWTKGGAEAVDVSTRMQGLDTALARDPLTSAGFDLLAQERGTRLMGSRMLRGRHMGARAPGMGYGLSEGVGVAMGLQRMSGMQGMYGNPASYKDVYNTFDASKDSLSEFLDREALGPTRVMTSSGTRGLLHGAMELHNSGIDMGTAQGSLASIFGATARGGGNGETSMRAIERAVERGTAKGFTDPRTQEELIGAMGRAAGGAILSDSSGLERVAAFLTAGGKPNMSVAETQGRVGALDGLNNLDRNNPFYQGVNVNSAFNIVGGKDPLKAMALAATPEELLRGGKQFDVHGITEQDRMRQLQASVGSKVQAHLSLLSSEEQQRYKEGGFQGLGSDSIFKVLRASHSFGNDQSAQGLADILASGDMTKLGKADGKRMTQTLDGLALASLSLEEQTKAKLIGEKLAQEIKEVFKTLSPDKMLEHMRESIAARDEAAFKNGDMLIVKFVGRYGESRDLPPRPKKKDEKDQ